jgi:hypothetical protein
MILDGRASAVPAPMPLLCQRTETQLERRGHSCDLNLLRYDDARTDLGCHGVQRVERGTQVARA